MPKRKANVEFKENVEQVEVLVKKRNGAKLFSTRKTKYQPPNSKGSSIHIFF